jgi:hypothetical protein
VPIGNLGDGTRNAVLVAAVELHAHSYKLAAWTRTGYDATFAHTAHTVNVIALAVGLPTRAAHEESS